MTPRPRSLPLLSYEMVSNGTLFSSGGSDENGAGGYEYEFVDNPHSDDYCAICLLPARDPQQTRCECAKLYCKSCYDKQRNTAGTCPTCRRPLDAFPDRNISRRIRCLKVKCTNSDCPWVNELGLLEAHRKTCGYVLMPCANGCGGHSNRDKLHYHYTEVCPLRPHTCIHCKEVGTYKEITSSHLDVCPDALVACPNSGCGASIKKRDITFHHSVCPDVKELCPNSECGANIKRKDMKSHLAECQYEIIGCIYRNIGCAFTSPRHAMVDHRASLSGYHLDLAMVQLEKQGEEIVKHLKEQQQKHVEEIMTQQKEQHQKHVEEMMAQLKEQHQKHVEEMVQLKEQYKIQVAYSEKITDLLKLKPSEEHVTLKMVSYDWHVRHKRSWYSNGFHTHHQGYKMCLNVDAFGSGEGEDTHVSVYLYLMKGENDDNLIWPLRYKCTITLLNQVMDGHHLAKTFKDEMSRVVPTGKKGSAAEGATARSLAGKSFPMLIAHDQLDLPEQVGQCKYLMDDCLYFRVQVKILPPPKPWLVLTC